jgi:hypothetical protein
MILYEYVISSVETAALNNLQTYSFTFKLMQTNFLHTCQQCKWCPYQPDRASGFESRPCYSCYGHFRGHYPHPPLLRCSSNLLNCIKFQCIFIEQLFLFRLYEEDWKYITGERWKVKGERRKAEGESVTFYDIVTGYVNLIHVARTLRALHEVCLQSSGFSERSIGCVVYKQENSQKVCSSTG